MQDFVQSYWQNLESKKLNFQTNVLNLLNKIAENQDGFVQINPYDTYNSLNPNFSVQNLNGTQGYILLRQDRKDIDKIHKEKNISQYTNLKGNLLIINELSWVFSINSKIKKFDFDSKNKADEKQINKFSNLLNEFLSLNTPISQELEVVIKNLANYGIILRNGIQNQLKKEEFRKESTKLWQTYTYFEANLDNQITLEKFADDLVLGFIWTLIFAKINSQDEELKLENISSFLPKSNAFLREYLGFLETLALNEFDWILSEILQDFNQLNPAIFDFQDQNENSLDIIYGLFCSCYYEDSTAELSKEIPQKLAKSIIKNLDLALKEDFEYKSGLANRYKVSFLDSGNSTTLALETLKVGIAGVASYSPRFALTIRKFLLQKIVSSQSQISVYILGQIRLSYFFEKLNYTVNPPEKSQFFLSDFFNPKKQKTTKEFLSIFEKEQNSIAEFEDDFLIISASIFGDFEKINTDFLFLLKKIEQNKEQIINILIDNDFLEANFFRNARYKLTNHFDKIYVFDLHGNQKIAEINPNGDLDENILDKKEGVAMLLCIKKEGIEKAIKTFDIFGQKEEKLDFLFKNDYQNIDWQEINPQSPNFSLKDVSLASIYQKGYPIDKIFKQKENPFKFRDKDCSFSADKMHKQKVLCRPFDFRWVIATEKEQNQENYYLHLVQKNKGNPHTYLLSNSKITKNYFEAEKVYSFPLYQYQKNDDFIGLFSNGEITKSDNFTQEFRNYIQDLYKQKMNEKDVLAYIYGTLWNQKYQSDYVQFLKNDYPRITFPKVKTQFKKSVILGKKLIQVHCFEKAGDKLLDNSLAKIKHLQKGKRDFHLDSFESMQVLDNQDFITLVINQNLHIENIPKAVYQFRIGNSKPVQNYLLARQKRILNQEQIQDFRRLIQVIAFSILLN